MKKDIKERSMDCMHCGKSFETEEWIDMALNINVIGSVCCSDKCNNAMYKAMYKAIEEAPWPEDDNR